MTENQPDGAHADEGAQSVPPVEPVTPFGPVAPIEPGGPGDDADTASLAAAEASTFIGFAPDAGTLRIPIPQQQQQIPASPPPPPAVPGDRWRAVTVGLLNLTGLGLGYALMRRWRAAVLCWIATGILVIIALPVSAGGIAGGDLVVYLIVLAVAAVHGALQGLHTPLTWPARPRVALGLAIVLLVVPAGASALFHQAQGNAIQQLLLGRLDQADEIIAGTEGEPFATAEPSYAPALATYRDLLADYPGSQAAQRVPARLAAFYQTLAAPYTAGQYCQAIAPLTYLRTLPATFTPAHLAALTTWPDDKLATSLYQCGTTGLATTTNPDATTDLNQLLATFPASPQAAKVEPAVAAAINTNAAAVNGTDPCTATTHLHTLQTQVATLSSTQAGTAAALSKDIGTLGQDIESGTYACGVAQYKNADYTDSLATMNTFLTTYPHDPNAPLAQKFTIAAQVAAQEPAAGKQLPTLASGGSVSVTILNDSPDALKILYTGPATGTVTLAACGSCSTYATNQDGQDNACTDTNTNYPQTSITLPPGTTYLLQEAPNDPDTTPSTFTEQYDADNAYQACAYETSPFGIGAI